MDIPLIKFGRSYKLQVETNQNVNFGDKYVPITLDITPPISLEFEIVRNNQASANTGTFTLYNLAPETRKQIFKDPMEMPSVNYRNIKLYAGYENPNLRKMLPLIFNGDVRSAVSERSGTEYRTTLECFDAGASIVSKRVAKPIQKGLTEKEVIRQLVAEFGLPEATIGDFLKPYSSRGQVFIGNASDILRELTQERFYIDNGRCIVLNEDEVLLGDITEVTSEMGLIGSPRRGTAIIEFDMVFEPRIVVGQQLKLTSRTADQLNWEGKVTGITHRGIISDSVAGECMTTVTMMTGAKVFKVVYG